MTRACHVAVRMATGDVFSDAEIDDMLDRLAERAKARGKEGPGVVDQAAIRQAAGDLTREELLNLLAKQREAKFTEAAKKLIEARLDTLPGNAARKLMAYLVGTEHQALGGNDSVDALGAAHSAKLLVGLEKAINQRPGLKNMLSNFGGMGDRKLDLNTAREIARLNGRDDIAPTGDEDAVHAAKAIVAMLDQGRQLQNARGAWIQELPGYIARQTHDAMKIAGGFWRELGESYRLAGQGKFGDAVDWDGLQARAAARAFEAWRSFIRPLLDDKTFEGLTPEDVDWTKALHADTDEELQGELKTVRAAQRQNARLRAMAGALGPGASVEDGMLFKVWADITLGQHEVVTGANDTADFRPTGSKAAAVSRARVLHFKGPDEWMSYNGRFGQGGLYASVVKQLERAGRNSALMERMGPAPERMFETQVNRLVKEARAQGPEGVPVANRLLSQKLSAAFEEVNGSGSRPENPRLALFMRNARATEALAKLGSMVLSKATDIPMTAHNMKRAGATFLDGHMGAVRGIMQLDGEDAKHVAEAWGAGVRTFSGNLVNRFYAQDGLSGFMGWASRLHYRLNLFDLVNDGVRASNGAMLARHLALEAEKGGLDAVNIGTREHLERFGISPEEWDQARQGLEPQDDGKTYLTPDHLERVGGQALEMKFRTMFQNFMDDAVSEARARERVAMYSGAKPGTLLGEAVRAMTQFHGFIRTILGRHLFPATLGYAGEKPVALMSHFLVGTILAGFLGLQAKQITAGRLPRDPTKLNTWTASLVQGGGLGIYGDFLFGEANREGLPATLSAFGGPMLSDAEQVASLVRLAVNASSPDADTRDRAKVLPGEAASFATHHVPLINLWYTRLALDYAVLWRLQEAASPGYLQRYESRVRSQQGTDFWFHPTSAQ